MSGPRDSDFDPRDPRSRPSDPAGTRPRHDPAALLPSRPVPERLAGGVVEGEAVEEDAAAPDPGAAPPGDLLPQRRAAGSLAPPGPRAEAPHAARFHFLYGALAAAGAAALALLVLALARGGGESGGGDPGAASWSAWQPTRPALAGATQIAAHVGRRYRLGDGRQLVSVKATALDYGGIPLTVAVRQPAAAGGDIDVHDGGGLIYHLCGLGPNCAIATGRRSPQRHLLLRREALELALYSLRYLDGVDQVAVYLPPPRGRKPSQAVYLRRADVRRQLDRPLARSLAPRTPTVRTIAASPDAAGVNRLTLAHLFSFSLTQANTEDRGFLVLDPLQVRTAAPARR